MDAGKCPLDKDMIQGVFFTGAGALGNSDTWDGIYNVS